MKILKQTSLWIILGSLAIGIGLFYFFDADGLAQQNWVYIIGFGSLSTALVSWPLSRLQAWKKSLGLLFYCSIYTLAFALIAPLSLSPLTAMQTMGIHLNDYAELPESAIHSENLILQTIARHKYANLLPRASFKIEVGSPYGDMQKGRLYCTHWNCRIEGLAATVRPYNRKLIVEAEDGSWQFILNEGLKAGSRYTENGVSLYIYPQDGLSSSNSSFGNPYEIRFCRWLQQHLAKDSSSYTVVPSTLSER